MSAINEYLEPILNTSGKVEAFWEKCINLGSPWIRNMLMPNPALKIKRPKSSAKGFTENKNFFIWLYELLWFN